MEFLEGKMEDRVLLAIYFGLAKSDSEEYFTPSQIRNFTNLDIGIALISRICHSLEEHELLTSYDDEGVYWFTLTREGFDEIEEIRKLEDWKNFTIPASDRLVTISHNSLEYSEAIEATGDAFESIRGSNSLDEAKRNWILDHLESGIDFIKNKKAILNSAVKSLLITPLQNAYEAVAEEPAKLAIQFAIAAIKKLFGL